MAADYTYAAAPVIVETTGELAIGATGVLRATVGGAPVAIYDINGSPISNILVGPKGSHHEFRADIAWGYLDFGSVQLVSESVQYRSAGQTALPLAQDAYDRSVQAYDLATEALTVGGDDARFVVHGDDPLFPRPTTAAGEGLVWVGTVEPVYANATLDRVVLSKTPAAQDPGGAVPPAAPTGLAAVAVSPTEIDVSWNAVGDCVYDIERDGVILRTARAGTTFNNVTGIGAGETHVYRIRAYDQVTDLRSDWSEPRSATTPTSAPVGFTFSDTFTRADASTLGSNYLEQTNKFGVISNRAAPLVASATLAATTGQATGGNQFAELKLTTLATASAFIGPAVRVPNTIGLTATTTDSYYVLLVSGTTDGILSIRRKEANATTITTLASVTRQAVAGDVIRLEVEGDAAPTLRAYVNGTLITGLTIQDTSGIHPPATNLRMGVHASGTVTAARFDDLNVGDLGAGTGTPPVSVPLAPEVVYADAISSSRIDVSWEASAGATYYKYRRNGGTIFTTENITFSDTGLAANTAYTYEVLAGNTAGESGWTSATATTLAVTTLAPGVPTGTTATASSPTEGTFSWAPPVDDSAHDPATFYNVRRNGVLRTNITATFVNDTNLTPQTAYSYEVQAGNTAGLSAFTAPKVFTTPALPTDGGGVVTPPSGSYKTLPFTTDYIKSLSTSNAGWNNLKTQADKTIAPNLNDFGSKAASHCLAAAFVYARTGDLAYRSKVVNALEQVRTWSGTFYYSAVYRQMAGWVMAADVVGHRTSAWVTFVDQIRTRGPLTGNSRFGRSMFYASWDSPNNHGAHARGAYAACSAFVGDTAAIANVKKWVNRWLGPDGASDWGVATSGSYNAGKFSPTDPANTLTWAHDPNNWYGINPSTAIPSKEGAVVMDIEREFTPYSVDGSGNPNWGGSGEQYSYGAMAGTLAAMVVLSANGYPTIWNWSDNAGVRWRNYLHRYGSTYQHSSGGWIDHFLNRKYTAAQRNNVTFSLNTNSDQYGFGFSNWLYP